jgi:penicillin-binding protein 2
MAQVTAVIANGGALWQPYLVDHIGTAGASGYQIIHQPTVLRQLELDEEALQIVREGMCDVTTVEGFGTAWLVFQDAPYTVCGKTGTAETAGQPNAWFVAYYPANDPQIAWAGVMANSREGSEVVAPMIRRILDDYQGAYRYPFPEWWQEPFNPLPSQDQALANYDPE